MKIRHGMLEMSRRIAMIGSILVFVGCGGGSGTGARHPEPVGDTCGPASAVAAGVCERFAEVVEVRATTPFVEDGRAVTLEVILYRPLSGNRFPTIVFNHGSTGNGSNPALFGETFTSKAIARYFVERGFMVAFPQRRGRGRSDGLYDEGFEPDRSGYSCAFDRATAGADRALTDINAITDWLRARSDVDTTRMIIAGTSRGGILSVAFLPQRPDVYRGAINFVGGWLGEGCGDYRDVNRGLFGRGAAFPGQTLWLYASADSFYSVDYSRSNFEAYANKGGLGQFNVFDRAAGLNGHFLINDPDLWAASVDAYLAGL